MRFILLLLFSASLCLGEDTLRIGIQDYCPMVMRTVVDYKGHDIELWENIAADNSYAYRYVWVDDFKKLFEGLGSDLDAIISGLTITEERERKYDCSHKYYRSGLGILVPETETLAGKIRSNLLFYSSLIIKLIPYFLIWALYVCFWALLVWFFERGNPDFNDSFGPGFPDARFFVHVVISSTGFGNQIPKSKWGRRIAVILMYSGIGFMFPMITGRISSEMTTYQLTNSIETKDDLADKNVAVKRGTTSADAVHKLRAKVFETRDMDSALILLKNGTVDAVVHDIPALKCLQKNNAGVTVLKEIFEDQDYGIILPQGSPLKENINRSILKFHENGFLEELKEKWLNDT